ncbi:hypothetical protein [Candidatus Poriferisodalis sp.]|uniref:hypothetical protein n=1 Tax=Candidatus Poriferisodalis sp. TaxID=3101277 RepID=UPI003B5BF6E8
MTQADSDVEAGAGCSYKPPRAINLDDNEIYYMSSGTDPLGIDLRAVQWESLQNDDWLKGPVCPVDSEDIDQIVSKRGTRFFSSSSGALRCHPDMRKPLLSFLSNVGWFAKNYGTGYEELELLVTEAQRRVLRSTGSFHYEGKALDIYWVGWKQDNRRIASRPCNGAAEAMDVTSRRRLVAVEAGLRKWFSYVLNRNINKHQHHFHVDNGCPGVALRVRNPATLGAGVFKRPYTSCNYFIQDCIDAFTDVQVDYDGSWNVTTVNGRKTQEGYKTLLSDFGMELLNPIKNVNEYFLFLDYVMMHGFADKRAGAFRWEGYATFPSV